MCGEKRREYARISLTHFSLLTGGAEGDIELNLVACLCIS